MTEDNLYEELRLRIEAHQFEIYEFTHSRSYFKCNELFKMAPSNYLYSSKGRDLIAKLWESFIVLQDKNFTGKCYIFSTNLGDVIGIEAWSTIYINGRIFSGL